MNNVIQHKLFFFSLFSQSKWLLQIQCNYKCRYILQWGISKIKLQLFQIDVLLSKIITTERENLLAHKMRHFFLDYVQKCVLNTRRNESRLIFFFISRTSRNRWMGSRNGQIFLLFSLMPPSVTMTKAPTNIFTVLTLNVLYWNNGCKQTLSLKVQWQIFILQICPDSKYAFKHSLFYRSVLLRNKIFRTMNLDCNSTRCMFITI